MHRKEDHLCLTKKNVALGITFPLFLPWSNPGKCEDATPPRQIFNTYVGAGIGSLLPGLGRDSSSYVSEMMEGNLAWSNLYSAIMYCHLAQPCQVTQNQDPLLIHADTRKNAGVKFSSLASQSCCRCYMIHEQLRKKGGLCRSPSLQRREFQLSKHLVNICYHFVR